MSRHHRPHYKQIKWGFWCGVAFCGIAAVLFGDNGLYTPMGVFVVLGVWCLLTAFVMAIEDYE